MKWIIETLGIVLCIQGFGGGLSAILDGGHSWFLVRHVLPEGAQFPVAAVLALAGVVILATQHAKRKDA
jgi:hypothetical protein